MTDTAFPDIDPARVVTTITDGVADVRLSRPDKRNALDAAMLAAIVHTGEALRHAPGVRVVYRSSRPTTNARRPVGPNRTGSSRRSLQTAEVRDAVIELEQAGDSAKAAVEADPDASSDTNTAVQDAHLAICILKTEV